ncbi:MAG: amidohydrolase family protein [Deltaproteobacteria bacterium]|nr:amidohydrolase family protein [Deltaproteobacteria bacterium]
MAPPPPPFDLVIRGGTVVTAQGRFQGDIGIRGSTIAKIGDTHGNAASAQMRGLCEIDAHERLITPGGVDPHVHLTCSDASEDDPGWVDDFESGSAAALAGGITTMGNMSFVLPWETIAHRLALESEQASRQSIADVFLHPAVLSPHPSIIAELGPTAEAGVTSMKFFMCLPSFDSAGGQYQMAMRAAAAAGSITLIHCEDLATISCCTKVLREKSPNAARPLRDFPDSRPVLAEVIATDRAIAMCEATGAPTYIVHLSSARALDACAAARARGLPVYVETRPLYLHLTGEHYGHDDGALYIAQPPLRQSHDRDALWAGLRDGTIDTMGSDHAPWTRAMKMDPTLDLSRLRPGVADLETMLPMLFSEGVLRGRISAERFVAVTSTNAARLFGLYPRKGCIAVGSDADLVIWETGRSRTIRGADMHSRAGHTVYEGRELTAWPHTTVRRGEVVFQEGRVRGKPGTGKVLMRGKTEAPTWSEK